VTRESESPITSKIGERRGRALDAGAPAYRKRREVVIDAAVRVLRKKGYAATTMGDIAAASGLDRASLYYYFRSKDEIFGALVGDAVIRLMADARAIDQSDVGPAEKLERMICSLMDTYARDYPHLYLYLQEDLDKIEVTSGTWREELVELGREYERTIVAVVVDGIADGTFRSDADPRVIMYAVTGMLSWTYRWYNPAGEWSSESLGKAFARLVLDGLTSR
jgi:TetR/AcrR family transcriptional regulator, cholesterol catabolism regulator